MFWDDSEVGRHGLREGRSGFYIMSLTFLVKQRNFRLLFVPMTDGTRKIECWPIHTSLFLLVFVTCTHMSDYIFIVKWFNIFKEKRLIKLNKNIHKNIYRININVVGNLLCFLIINVRKRLSSFVSVVDYSLREP